MNQKDFNRLILNRIESSYDLIMLIGGIVAFVSAVVLYIGPIPLRFVVSNLVIGIALVMVYINRKNLQIESKILFGIMVPIAMGVHSFTDGGFNTSAMTLVLLSNAVAVLFLSRKQSMMISVGSVLIFIGLWFWSSITDFLEPSDLSNTIWVMQILMMLLFIALFQIAVHTIRRYLMENIVQLEEAVEMTHKLAYYDQLTGVRNKNGLMDYLREHITVNGPGGCLVFISVRHLNLINAIFNVEVGDKLLADFAAYFEANSREHEILARVGGNEFAIYLVEDERERLISRLIAMREDFRKHVINPEIKTRMDFFASYTWLDSEDIEGSYQQAGLAMTYAKYREEIHAVAYDETFEAHMKHEEHLKDLLKDAVDQDKFYMSYQTKVHVATDKVIGVEALARLEMEDYGCVSPAIFVPMIEELNLSIEFGRLTFRRVLADYEALRDKYGENISVSVNISPSFLRSEGFDAFIYEEMLIRGLPADRLILEITEEVVIKGVDQVNRILAPSRARGIRISLDDFGTGYSSLSYLSSIAVDEIKIDKSFIDQMLVNRKTKILLEAMVQLAGRYELDIVAEGVEKKAQRDMLVAINCPNIQGYLYSKPERL